ncbi:MAG: membrane protein insertase YidC [Deltaproteobacteria bacterium]|nr:membrane protein insertase YidC [Deltaproteobacteria bacterium]
MEGQGKRLLLAVALALGVMLAWSWIFPSEEAQQPKTGSGSGSGSTSAVPTMQVPTSQFGVSTQPGHKEMAPATKVEPHESTITNSRFTAKFSSVDGVMSSWKLADPRYDRDDSKGEMLGRPEEKTNLEKKDELVGSGGAFFVNYWQSELVVPRGVEWKRTSGADTQQCEVSGDAGCKISYRYSSDLFDLEKTYTIIPEAYLVQFNVKAQVKLTGDQTAQQALAVRVWSFEKPDTKEKGGNQTAARLFASSTLRDGTLYNTSFKDLLKHPRWEPSITWTGFEHPYLLAAYAPKPPNAMFEDVQKHTYADAAGDMWTDIVYPWMKVKANDGPMSREIVAYLGPKNYADLDRADGYAAFSTGFKDTIDLGWFAFIGRPLLWLLLKFYSFVGNWGIAIILLTFLVKAATLYWTTKSMRSMKAMAGLAPQIKTINDKYKDDRQRIQAETMALYKQHNVNPIAGCLPILLQMPIWIALYRMLSSAGELYMQPFIPGWINDLTATDPYYILPFVLVGTMFVQARLTPATGDSRQQKFLQYGMPLMFGVMSFFFPAGLTLYIFTNTVLSALHSIYMNKYDKKSLELTAKMRAAAEAAKAAEKPAAKKGDAKPGAGAKPNKPAAKPVIDVESSSSSDGDDDTDAAPASSPAKPRPNQNKKKKRKR